MSASLRGKLSSIIVSSLTFLCTFFQFIEQFIQFPRSLGKKEILEQSCLPSLFNYKSYLYIESYFVNFRDELFFLTMIAWKMIAKEDIKLIKNNIEFNFKIRLIISIFWITVSINILNNIESLFYRDLVFYWILFVIVVH